MDIIEAVKTTFERMKNKRFFVSEADFQSALAWELTETFKQDPTIKVYREFPIRVFRDKWRTIYIDLVVVKDGKMFPIELKYKTAVVESDATYENTNIPMRHILKPHGAQDENGYDFWKDISRIEGMIDRGEAERGICIMVSNDKAYWQAKCREGTQAYAFRLLAGHKARGPYRWNFTRCANPDKILNVRPHLDILNDYDFEWVDFCTVPDVPNGLFRCLVVPIPPKKK